MDLLSALLQLAAFVLAGLGLALPRLRKPALAALAAAAVASGLAAALGPDMRTLVTTHAYAGYEGPGALEVSMVDFPTGTATAPGWQWPLPFLGFAVLWACVLLRAGGRELRSAFLMPLLLAWTAAAALLGTQWLAGPSAAVSPAGLDRCLWPGSLAISLLAARRARNLLTLAATISATVLVVRAPIAFFSRYATEHQIGTSLDVSNVVDIANPMTGMVFQPALVPGSPEHTFWLIWLEHLIIFPALHWLSLFGIALGVHLWHKHPGE